MRHQRRWFVGLVVMGFISVRGHVFAAENTEGPVPPGTDLQAVLDKGENLLLQPAKVYPVKKALLFKKTNQSISTFGATQLSDYAVLRIVDPECPQLVNGNNQDGVILERLVLDGNRGEQHHYWWGGRLWVHRQRG